MSETGHGLSRCGLQQAIEAIGPRFELLVATQRERFTVPFQGYWANFYT